MPRVTGLLGAAALALGLLVGGGARAAGEAERPPHHGFSFSGVFGSFDQGAAQRGFLVYKQVCASCHGLRLVSYRNLREIGLSEDQVRAIAASVQVMDGPNDEGQMFERAGRASDRFRSPHANDQAARAANNGALPPDLSLMSKAREGGADYIAALLTGYEEPPAGVTLAEGMHYNRYFPGHQIAMAPPLSGDGLVDYADGTQASVAQMSRDVATFLAWAAEPEMTVRKRMGIKMVLFFLLLLGLAYAVKRRVWAHAH